MVAAAAFPLAKLGILLVKQVSKPLANTITNRARQSRVFRDYFCIPLAQFFHWADVKIRMRILNLGKIQTVPKLDEKKAIETGAQIFSEFIILFVASSAIFFEYRRSAAKEEAKLAALEMEKQDFQNRVRELELTADRRDAQMRELTRLVITLRDEMVKKHSGIFSKTTIPVPQTLLEEPKPEQKPEMKTPEDVAFNFEKCSTTWRSLSPVMRDAVFIRSVRFEEA